MKRAKPFPSLSLMLPDDIAEDADSGIASYWKQDNNNCLLQILFREWGPQVSALHHLPERTSAGGEWQAVSLAGTIEGCDIAAAPTTDAQNTSWVHVYLVWDWLAVRVTISHKGKAGAFNRSTQHQIKANV